MSFALLGARAAAQQEDWQYAMDFGPCLLTTLDGRGQSDFTVKGLVVKLDVHPDGGAVTFDTELLRLSAAWTDGWLWLIGTAYDGSHGPQPRLRGRKIAETKPQPGWALDGSFADPRSIPYGPLPKDRAQYRGHFVHGDRVVVSYRVGDMDVLEGYAIETAGGHRFPVRTLNVGPSAKSQTMVVMDTGAPDKRGEVDFEIASPKGDATTSFAVLQWDHLSYIPEFDVTTLGWDDLAIGAPSIADLLDASSGRGATIELVPDFAPLAGWRRDTSAKEIEAGVTAEEAAAALHRLCDGCGPESDRDQRGSVVFGRERGRREGKAPRKDGRDGEGKAAQEPKRDDARLCIDLKKRTRLTRVSTFSWHRGRRGVQKYTLFGSDAATAPARDAADLAAAGWKQIARVDTTEFGGGDKNGAAIDGSILGPEGGPLRHLLFVVDDGATAFCEIDVFGGDRIAPAYASRLDLPHAGCALKAPADAAKIELRGSRVLLHVPAHAEPLRLKLLLTSGGQERLGAFAEQALASGLAEDLAPFTKPGPGRRGEPIVTKGTVGEPADGFAVDTIAIPFENRFGSRMRTCAFDFFTDGRAAITTWNGDVWIVSGLDAALDRVEWRRFATGLFDPLGLRIVGDVVYVHGRDGITRLRDGNGDGEADAYECFNHDVTATPAFHEFAFDLQTDAEGNFYCSKGGPVNPGGRGFMKIVPHHGTVMRISKDGSRLDVVASGLRAPNGIGVSPTGILTTGDNEGSYIPRCRLNWIERPGFYAGVKDTAHREQTPAEPDLPLCWFPMEVDNSSGGQVWVPEGGPWRSLGGRLLHLSYGTCSTYLVLRDETPAGEPVQGGVVRLPCNFTSSCMRARFHPKDGQLYVAGFQGWQTSAAREGGFHRVRRTAEPLSIPTSLRTSEKGIYLTFERELDPETATDPDSYGIEIWNYRYSQSYGSPEVSLLHPDREVEQGKPNRDPLPVTAAKLSPDGRTVFLAVDGMRPVQQLRVTWNVDAKARPGASGGGGGAALKGEVNATIHALAPDAGFPQPGAKKTDAAR